MKLTMVISSLSCGGAERIMSQMANYWTEMGWEITILTLADGGEPPFFELHPKVIHRILHQDITRLEECGMPLRRLTYPRTTCLTVLTSDDLMYFSSALQRKGYVIPNAVVLPPDYDHEEELDRTSNTIIAVGRLGNEKGHDLLMRAFAAIASRCPGWSVTIWGEGELRTELEVLRDRLGLQGRVFLPGQTKKIHEKMKRADLFVMPSRYEGFGNVLCEAMACGLPVISFDCPNGPRHIIRNATDGILVPPEDIGALSAAMEKLIHEPETRDRLALYASEITERFGLEKIMKMWEMVIYGAMNCSHTRYKALSSRP